MRLTDFAIRSLPIPEKGQKDYWDDLKGFGIRVSQGGSRTFIVMHRGSRKALGRYPLLGLAEARERARALLYELHVKPNKRPSIPYTEAVDRYLRLVEPELRHSTFVEYKRYLTNRFRFNGLLEEIAAHEIVDQLDAIEGPSERTHAYTALKIFLNWCCQREYLDRNPMEKLKKPKVPSARERVLNDTELAGVWTATTALGRFGIIMRLLICLGQRANQVASLQEQWVDFDKKVITFPRDIMKANKEHVLPFGTITEELLRSVTPTQGYYFSPNGIGRPFTAWSKNKAALDKLLDFDAPFTIHDLRRTWSTNAPRLDIPPHITERVLAHKHPHGKIAAIYDRFRYTAELRSAIEKMESFVVNLLPA
jgi:integrase